MPPPMAQMLRRLEALEAEKAKDRAAMEKDRLREELKATFTAALLAQKQALQAEIREQALRAETEKQALRAETEKQALRAETERQALRAETEKQALRAQLETDKKIETGRRGLEERMQAALENQALRAQIGKQALRAEIEKMRAAFEKQALRAEIEKQRADTDKKLLEERMRMERARLEQEMERARLQSQMKEISHSQGTGGDQANAIYLELERMGFKVWYDNRASDLTKEGMLKGIERAAAFLLFLSVDVLQRPYCQMEIRHALALKKPVILVHESDARYGSFDFRAAHAEAEADLRELLDRTESLPFRRRGYERDGMLKTVVERAGFAQIYASAQEGAGSKAGTLAELPAELGHFALDALFERPVQAQLVELLLLPKEHGRFTSCVLVHGMGGTGKTVTAVATIQETSIRQHFRSIYWLAVGADAVGGRIKQLQAMLLKQLTGKEEKAEKKDEHELQRTLVEAMTTKQRALVVLDDPWMPEQVRFLNPIDSLQTEHRLLATTRIRDLVPKATRVELPLMGKDEAVALLLELANVEEAEYRKENPDSPWPPPAAYTIAAECGLLPITLTIAAQVVRSWGEGWETSVLPLLREEEGSGQSRTSVEERVIGAGLQALAKNEDGAAIKELFHMFAVTQEDFVHPMAVIELLWRSCCASDAEKQEGGLAVRLKVRQWTQMLVDHSLLLGSSSEGVHLHDIVLQYLRKRLSAEEMRKLHIAVVDGMVSASQERVAAVGRRFEWTGATAKPVDGEVSGRLPANPAIDMISYLYDIQPPQEIDWYCGNVGLFHVTGARDTSFGWAKFYPRWSFLCGASPRDWDNGSELTEENVTESVRLWVEDLLPQFRKAMVCCVNSERIATIQHSASAEVWGQNNEHVLAGVRGYSLDRHTMIARSLATGLDDFISFNLSSRVLEHSGEVKAAVEMQLKQFRLIHQLIRAGTTAGELKQFFGLSMGYCVNNAAEEGTHSFRAEVVKVFEMVGCNDTPDCEGWLQTSQWKGHFSRGGSSRDGKHWMRSFSEHKALLCAGLSLAVPATRSVDASWMDNLLPTTSPEMVDCSWQTHNVVGSRTLIAEAMERARRFTDAIEWLQVDIADEFNASSTSKCRAGAVLEIGNLKSLQKLYLFANELGGSLPPALGNLSALTDLLVSENLFTGTIPPTLGSLSRLSMLGIAFNKFVGTIPPSLAECRQLRTIKGNYNQLQGPLPDNFGKLSNLIYLILGYNQLTGPIPSSIGQLTNLFDVELQNNYFTSLPTEIGLLSSVTSFSFGFNALQGPLPSAIARMPALTSLFLENNQLNSSLPSELGSMTKLMQLELDNNHFEGTIPSELGRLTCLQTMHLQSNHLTGPIPSSLGSLKVLESLLLQDNNLTGVVPTPVEQLACSFANTTRVCNFGDNQLSDCAKTPCSRSTCGACAGAGGAPLLKK
eukprot:g170.t1